MKSYQKIAIQVLVILIIGVGFVWLSSSLDRQKPQEEIVKEVVKEIILKKPACPNTSDYFAELKSAGQSVMLAKNLNSYGTDGHFTNIKTTIVKSAGSGSQIACGYLYIKAHVAGRALQEKYEHPYVKPDEFGGHLIMDQAILNKVEAGTTELLFNLSSINYTEKLSSEIRKADWAALLNVSDRTSFDVALSTINKDGIIDEASIAYQCWNPETGQITHDCRLTVVE